MSYTDKEMQVSTQIAYMNITQDQINEYLKDHNGEYPTIQDPEHQHRHAGSTAAYGNFTGRIHAGYPGLPGTAPGGSAVRNGTGAPRSAGTALSCRIPQPQLSHRTNGGADEG